ncbi:MAG TPA: mechanosensitive ion channel family protein [Steroidobacteraceae bacterium]|nr:mechanosensitive ion channel family protein [Steroidobacteraceae bacterium]
MQSIRELLNIAIFDNTLEAWGLAVLAFLITFTVLPLLKRYLLRLARRQSQGRNFSAVQLSLRLIPRTSRLFMWVLALFAAEQFLKLSRPVEQALKILVLLGVCFQIGLWAMTAVEFFLERKQRERGERDSGFVSSFGIINFVARALIWSVVSLLALDNLGVNITALVAGLGVGGIAIALAVQTMLGDLLASLSIALDKPFAVGDDLMLDNIQGKVEQIGIRSTRLRSVNGEQIIVSNADLAKGRVRNFGRMEERRGVIALAISHDTSPEKLRKVNAIVEQAIHAQRKIRLERCYFKEIGATAFNFEATIFAVDGSFDTLSIAQQNINFQVIEAFATEKIELAAPLQAVRLTSS